MSPFEWLTAIVALYGAILSSIVFISQRMRFRRTLKVILRIGFSIVSGEAPQTILVLEVRNPGNRAVTLTSFCYELADGQYLYILKPLTGVTMPYELGDSKSCSFSSPTLEASRALLEKGYAGVVKLRGIVSDGSGLTFRSKYLKFSINCGEEL